MHSTIVMAGLLPAIHEAAFGFRAQGVDAQDKPGDDGIVVDGKA